MTEQEAYEKIRAHFANESNPFPAVKVDEDGFGHCVYRDEREAGIVARCAVGCLISDEQYEEWGMQDFEGSTAAYLLAENQGAHEAFSNIRAFLSTVQGLHDAYSKPNSRSHETREHFLSELDDLAEGYGLEVKH